MKKIQLDIEALEVSTFETEPGSQAARGTVEGHATTICPTAWCPTGATCGPDSCVESCLSGNVGCHGC